MAKPQQRARTSGKGGGFSLLPPQSPRSFTALAHLGLFARQTKTAMLRRLKSDQCSTPLLHVGFGVCFDVSVGLDYGDTGFKADVENTRRRECQHPVKSLPGNCSKTSANGPPPYAETSCQGTLTVFTRLNAADGSKITNKCRTQSEKFGVYSMIVRKKNSMQLSNLDHPVN